MKNKYLVNRYNPKEWLYQAFGFKPVSSFEKCMYLIQLAIKDGH